MTDGEGVPAAVGRVLFLGHGTERTGPPILLGHLLRGLRGDRYRCSVLVARSGPMVAEYEASGAAVKSIGSGREPLEPLAAALRRLGAGRAVPELQRRWLRARARSGPVDLVYVNAATPPTAALLHALDVAPATPVILHVHELDVGLRLTLAPEDLAFLTARADRIIAASEAVTRLLVDGHGMDASRVVTCAEFVDADRVRPEPRPAARAALGIPVDALVVGSVGLADWRKDPEHLLRAAAHLRRSRPHLHPWVAWIGGDPTSGDGRRLRDEARRLGLADRFVHHAHTDRPDGLLGALDVFALPAREDALPLAALEAAATGLPLVCFRTGGIAALADQGAGRAVDYPDTVAFAEAVGDLLADPEARRRSGRRASELVIAHHSLDVGVERIRHQIDQALAAPRRAGGS